MPMSMWVGGAIMEMARERRRESWMPLAILYLAVVEMYRIDVDLNYYR